MPATTCVKHASSLRRRGGRWTLLSRICLGCGSGRGRSQADIAEQIGVSQMQSSRLLSRVLGKIRELLQVEEDRATA